MSKKSNPTTQTIAKWQKARFGIFIHWGVYSATDLDCWKVYNMGMPIKDYIEKYEPKFTGNNFDAKAIVSFAKQAGCKYIVMGTRHHEGYCLWNTKTTNFSSVHMTPKRDFIAEFVKAARSAGLMVGFYYSLLDWRHKAYWDGPRKDPANWSKFVTYVHAQAKELMTDYGKIDVLWYDGGWESISQTPLTTGWGFDPTDAQYAHAWKSKKLNAMARKFQPGIIINNRSYLPEDFGTPEKVITPEDRPWELCDTIGHYWGCSTRDLDRKSPKTLISRLIYCVANNGNMLLNVGPKPNGNIMGWQKQRMLAIGQWLDKHGEAIYGCTGEWAMPFNEGLAPWQTTRKGNTLYMHLLRYPGQSFGIANLHDYHLISAELMDTGDKLKITHNSTNDIISSLPLKSPDPIASVVRIKFRKKTKDQLKQRKYIGIDNPDNL